MNIRATSNKWFNLSSIETHFYELILIIVIDFE